MTTNIQALAEEGMITVLSQRRRWRRAQKVTEKIGSCSVRQRTFVGARTQTLWQNGGDWFHILVCKINLYSKLTENQNMSFDSFLERKNEQQEKKMKERRRERKSKLCSLTPPARRLSSWNATSAAVLAPVGGGSNSFSFPSRVHTPNVSKNTVLEDARCDFQRQEEEGLLGWSTYSRKTHHTARDLQHQLILAMPSKTLSAQQ